MDADMARFVCEVVKSLGHLLFKFSLGSRRV